MSITVCDLSLELNAVSAAEMKDEMFICDLMLHKNKK